MSGKRRRFSGELKAKIALEALRGDRTLQEIAARHQVHPNQVSTWKRQAMEGLSEVFSGGGERRARDRESEVRDLHAKIGELIVERDFCRENVWGSAQTTPLRRWCSSGVAEFTVGNRRPVGWLRPVGFPDVARSRPPPSASTFSFYGVAEPPAMKVLSRGSGR